jgi:hypothetical protein
MKHEHSARADVNINVNLPTSEIESLISTATDATIVIIGALTLSHVVKSIFNR